MVSQKNDDGGNIYSSVVAGLAVGIAFVLVFSFLMNGNSPILGKLSSFASPDGEQQAMLERGNIAMRFDQNKIMHHFMATPTGGRIMIVALNNGDTESIAQIKMHVLDIKQEFSKGNFKKPFFIHDQQVPGTDVMAEKKDFIKYSIQQLDNGAVLVLTTDDKEVINAIQQFMNFQGKVHMGH